MGFADMGNTLIVYASNYGTVEKCARQLLQLLNGNVDICRLQEREAFPHLENYDAVIVGGSIRFGAIQQSITQYCISNMDVLLEKRLGLFINCLFSGERAQKQLDEAFPLKLRERAVISECLGGELAKSGMSFWERAAVSVIIRSGIAGDVVVVSDEKIADFADKMNSADGFSEN